MFDKTLIDRLKNKIHRLLKSIPKATGYTGACILLYGLFLIGAQTYVWLEEGYWIALPVSDLFVDPFRASESDKLIDDLAVRKRSLETILAIEKELSTNEKRLESQRYFWKNFLPTSMQSNDSWFAAPWSWFGVHKLLDGALSFLNIGVVAAAIGYLFIRIAIFYDEDVGH